MTRCAAIAFISAWKCYVMIHCTVQVGLGQLGFLSPGYIPPAWYVHFQTTWFLEKMQCVNDEQIKVFNGVHESIKRYIALHWKKEKTIPHSTNKVLAWKKNNSDKSRKYSTSMYNPMVFQRSVEFPFAQEVIALLLERLNRQNSNVTRDEERRSVFHGKLNQKVVSS